MKIKFTALLLLICFSAHAQYNGQARVENIRLNPNVSCINLVETIITDRKMVLYTAIPPKLENGAVKTQFGTADGTTAVVFNCFKYKDDSRQLLQIVAKER